MYKKENAIKIVEILKSYFPDAKCSLNFSTPFELLVATILSAQCTDERVNKTTPTIFSKYSTPEDFANIDINELEDLIHPCGFYKNKAKNIKACSQKILTNYNGEVPKTAEELITLPGVGRKTANVIISEAFKGDAFAVDTHVLRIASRLGLTESKNPDQVEEDLKKFFPKDSWSKLHYQIVLFGRYKCKAVKPDCTSCLFQSICKYFQGKRANNN